VNTARTVATGIPESQLETWAKQGAVQTSSSTYTSVQTALERGTRISSKSWDKFLQGSYANATNIRGDSDVDVVCRLDSIFHRDISQLSVNDRALYGSAFSDATYSFADFKRDVTADLQDYYGRNLVVPGDNAVWVKAANGRLNADVIVCCQYRHYLEFRSLSDQNYIEGITFWRSDGTQIINYPKRHRDSCTSKHQATNEWFKPVVRIVKNIRSRMVDDGLLNDDVAPSYFLEGLVWNALNSCFGRSYRDSIIAVYNHLIGSTDAVWDSWTCPNEVYYLFGDRPEQWTKQQCRTFLQAFKTYWENY
jgi:hypothetical protein